MILASINLVWPSLPVQHTFLSPCSLFYSSDAEHRKVCNHNTPFAVRIALVWFVLRKRERSQRRCWECDGREMQVVLLEQLSSSHDQQACFEPLFLLQKTLICDIICLRVAHAVRRLCAHPPHAVDGCLPAPRRRAPAPTNGFGSASSTARSAPAGPQGTGWSLCQPLSLGWRGGCCRGLRSWHSECHLRNLSTAFQDVAQTCLLSPYLRKCARAAGLLGWGRCVCMVFCRHATLFCVQSWPDISQLWARSKFIRLDSAPC